MNPTDLSQTQHSPEHSDTILCSICVSTYLRPDWLNQLLDSLLAQNLPDGVTIEIVVVDNDKERSAEPIVQSYTEPRFPIYYHVEPRKNISHSRNKAVHNASGEYILFVDDDEVANPDWVAEMLKALQTYDADGVYGRIVPNFNENAPDWVHGLAVFDRPFEPTGTIAKAPGPTANCLIKSSVLKSEEGPFDARYGITGGEDTHLFERLLRKNARFVFCEEGWVSEFIPESRTTEDWVVKRAFRTGNIYGRRQIEMSGNALVARIKLAITSVINVVVAGGLMLLNWGNVKRRWHWRLKMASNRGRVISVFNRQIDGY